MVVADYMGEAITDEYFVKLSGDDAVSRICISGAFRLNQRLQAQSMVDKITSL